MATLFANKYVQLFLRWLLTKVIFPYLKDTGLDAIVDIRVKAALASYDKKYEAVVKEFELLRAKNALTEVEIARIRNEKIKLEEQLINSIKR